MEYALETELEDALRRDVAVGKMQTSVWWI